MNRCVFSFSLAILVAGGTCVAADLTEQYRATADKLIDAALADTEGYDRLAYLCYRIGKRLSGSPGLERAIAWCVETMKAAGLSNVRMIPAKVPHWVRGAESARMMAPLDKPLHMLGLGMSVGTPPGGITADVVAVATFDDLAKLGAAEDPGKDRAVQRGVQRLRSHSRVPRHGRLAGRGIRRGGGAGALGHAACHADSAHRRDELRRAAAQDSGGRGLAGGCHDDRPPGGATACR